MLNYFRYTQVIVCIEDPATALKQEHAKTSRLLLEDHLNQKSKLMVEAQEYIFILYHSPSHERLFGFEMWTLHRSLIPGTN